MPKPNPRSVGEKQLEALKEAGVLSAVLNGRLAFADVATTLKYLAPLVGQGRVFPGMLPTQKSGRWSTTDPPLVNFSPDCINPDCTIPKPHKKNVSEACWSLREVVRPDPGWYWEHWDWDAIEGKISAAFSDDVEDLSLFNEGLDIHTVTVCKMFGLPAPPDLADPHKADSCKDWRQAVAWGGKDDRRRGTAKAARYALAYGSDESAILRAKDVEQMGMSREELLGAAVQYMRAKPHLQSFKHRAWEQCLIDKEARSFLGRRRKLFITGQEIAAWKKGRMVSRKWAENGKLYTEKKWRQLPGHAQREGLNHMHQGSVADLMNLAIIAIQRRWPEAYLVYQSHDGCNFAFPEHIECQPEIRGFVEREWEVNGHKVFFSATWDRRYADAERPAVLA